MVVRIDKYPHGEGRDQDCLEGLKDIPDKSFELCLTDPPWNIGFIEGKGTSCYNKKRKKHTTVAYIDNIKNYEKFSLEWFREIERICERVILAPGRQNLGFWYKNTSPLDFFVHIKKNGSFGSKVGIFNNLDVYLYYGKMISKPFWNSNVLHFDREPTGFLGQNHIYLHSSPKNYKLWFEIVKGIKPSSTLDPFLGSGTTAEVCEKLGIKWLGFEINEVYSQDINKRLKNIKVEPKQVSLEVFK